MIARRFYSDVRRNGFLVIGIGAIDGTSVGDTISAWFPYAVLTEYRTVRLYWINHGTQECVPYADALGNRIDPNADHHEKTKES